MSRTQVENLAEHAAYGANNKQHSFRAPGWRAGQPAPISDPLQLTLHSHVIPGGIFPRAFTHGQQCHGLFRLPHCKSMSSDQNPGYTGGQGQCYVKKTISHPPSRTQLDARGNLAPPCTPGCWLQQQGRGWRQDWFMPEWGRSAGQDVRITPCSKKGCKASASRGSFAANPL